MFDKDDGGSILLGDIKNKAHMSCFSSRFIPAIGSSSKSRSGSMARAPPVRPFLQPVGKTANRGFPDRLIEKIDNFSASSRCRISHPWPVRNKGPARKGFFHFEVPARHDVVQSRHSFKQCNILKVLAIPEPRLRGMHLLSMESLEMNLTLLRMVEAVDHIQHGRLACSVWPDDRHDLLFFHRKTNILEAFTP